MERTERIEEEVKKVVGKLIDQELKDPRLTGLISITKVYVTRDLKICKIYVSMLGTQDKDAAMSALKSASGIARKAIGDNIRMHFTPEVSFEFDDSLEYGEHIQNLINGLNIKQDEVESENS